MGLFIFCLSRDIHNLSKRLRILGLSVIIIIIQRKEGAVMRLRNIYIICRDNIETIDKIAATPLTGSNNGYSQVTGWKEASRVIVNELFSIDFLKEKGEELIKCIPEIYRAYDSFKVLSSDWNKIFNARKILREGMADVIGLYESMGLESEEPLGVDIKLPKCKDLSELKKCIDDLDFVLYKSPLFRNETENLEFKTVDVGSLWLTFAVIGAGLFRRVLS